MKTFALILFTSLSFSQTSYVNGQTGIEFIARDRDTMYVYQQQQAKMEIRREVGAEILNTYLENKNKGGIKVICTSKGEVTGMLTITRKVNENAKPGSPKGIVLLDFQYLSILWNDGTLEKTIVKKILPKKKKV